MAAFLTVSVLTAVATALNSFEIRADNTAVVHLGTSKGAAEHLASGFIYGVPDTRGQIPSEYWTQLDIQGCRTGGAQLGSPARGWVWGRSEYKGRFASSLSNYQQCREYNAEVSWLAHDLWGTDSTNDSTIWPGDGGQWDSYDAFVLQLVEDLYDNEVLDGSIYEIWNEPDIGVFWKGEGGMQQWIDLYIRTHKLIRADSRFDSLKLVGPSLAFRPMGSNLWWTEWLRQVAGNDTIPDQYTYHLEGTLVEADNDPSYTNASLSTLLDTYGLPSRQINVNEYAQYIEMVPGSYIWWISGLERFDFIGLLGNWQGGTTLHDLFANLLTKTADPYDYSATDYAPAPGYWVYQYYASNMTGNRVAVDRSGDTHLDVYATVGDDRVRLMVGTKLISGTWYVTINDLESVGLPVSGTLTIDTWRFNGNDPLAAQAAPSFRNSVPHDYTDGALTIAIYQENNYTGWAFEFDVGA